MIQFNLLFSIKIHFFFAKQDTPQIHAFRFDRVYVPSSGREGTVTDVFNLAHVQVPVVDAVFSNFVDLQVPRDNDVFVNYRGKTIQSVSCGGNFELVFDIHELRDFVLRHSGQPIVIYFACSDAPDQEKCVQRYEVQFIELDASGVEIDWQLVEHREMAYPLGTELVRCNFRKL